MQFTGSLGFQPLSYVSPGQKDTPPAQYALSVQAAWTGTASSSQVRNVSGSVTATFTAAASDSAHRSVSGTVTSSFTAYAYDSSAKNQEQPVFLTSGWQATASASKNRAALASVTSGFQVSSSTSEVSARRVTVSAASTLAASTSERVAQIHAVTVQATSQWHSSTQTRTAGAFYGTVTSTAFLTSSPRGSVYPPHVNTATAWTIASATTASVLGAKYVTADGGGFKAKVTTSEVHIGVYRETATSGVEVRSLVSENVAAPRTAGAAARFQTATSATRALPRTVPAGATFGAEAKTTNLKRVTAVSTVALASRVSAAIGGQEVDAGSVLFRSVTRATVWLPWRHESLTLPPAGNLPHST